MIDAVYAGTFDPPTIGHLDVVEAAVKMGFSVVWLFAVNDSKNPMFSLSERMQMAVEASSKFSAPRELRIDYTPGLVVDYAKSLGIPVMIRSFRNAIDVAYEMEIQQNNAILAADVSTIFIPPKAEHTYISSSAVRMLIKNKRFHALNSYCPECVVDYVMRRE